MKKVAYFVSWITMGSPLTISNGIIFSNLKGHDLLSYATEEVGKLIQTDKFTILSINRLE